MSLFKYPILNTYNILYYKNDYLYLHCSRYDALYAPFDGEIIQKNNDYVLYNDNVELYFTHVKNVVLGKVKAGDSIALPIVDNMFKYNTATVGIKIYKNKQLDDIVKHLNSVKNINKMVEAETVEIVEAEEIKPKKKSTRKKK